jgi:hypothetical protein
VGDGDDDQGDAQPVASSTDAMVRDAGRSMLAFRSVQQSNHCVRDEFLYELKQSNHCVRDEFLYELKRRLRVAASRPSSPPRAGAHGSPATHSPPQHSAAVPTTRLPSSGMVERGRGVVDRIGCSASEGG